MGAHRVAAEMCGRLFLAVESRREDSEQLIGPAHYVLESQIRPDRA